jgi:hypothetical protein
MAAFWAEMGVAYLEINKLPCSHEIDIPELAKIVGPIGPDRQNNGRSE